MPFVFCFCFSAAVLSSGAARAKQAWEAEAVQVDETEPCSILEPGFGFEFFYFGKSRGVEGYRDLSCEEVVRGEKGNYFECGLG